MEPKKLIIYFRMIISVTFIFSAVTKILSPGYFEITLVEQGLFSDRELAAIFTRIFIACELSIGLLFLQKNYLKNIISPVTLALLVIFSVHMLILLLLGDKENCGCFSSVINMNPLEAIIKNIVLVIMTYFVFKYSEKVVNKNAFPTSIIILSIISVFITAPIKTSDKLPFSQYTNFQNASRVDLTDGEHLVAIFDASCEHCIETAKSLKRINNELNEFPTVYQLIFAESEGDMKNFISLTENSFPYHKIDIDAFFNLIGSAPPRIYWIDDGKIFKTFDENIDVELWNIFSTRENTIFEFPFEE